MALAVRVMGVGRALGRAATDAGDEDAALAPGSVDAGSGAAVLSGHRGCLLEPGPHRPLKVRYAAAR